MQSALDGYGFHRHPLQGELGRRAVGSGYAEDLSVYDAAYLELARLLEAQLTTDDAALIHAGGETALPLRDYISPFDVGAGRAPDSGPEGAQTSYTQRGDSAGYRG